MSISENGQCALCRVARHELPAVILYEDQNVMAVMDLHPATRGHILVIPRQHFEDIHTIPKETGSLIMKTAITLANAVKRQLKPAGLNLVQANGTAAGQTIFHFHLHILPRYQDDCIELKFGHGKEPSAMGELEKIASQISGGFSIDK